MSEIKLTINGKLCTGKQGETILTIAERNGIVIPTLCHNESVAHYGACGLCVVECEGTPKLLRSCSTLAADGMVIDTEGARAVQARRVALELLMSDHDGDCQGPCRLACPAGTDCQAYVKQVALGNTREAVRIVKERLPLPASIGHVCPHPCEKECRRNLVEEPISIALIKRYMSMAELGKPDAWKPERAPATGKTVGVIGGGPAGLTAAYYLALKGHDVTLTEQMPQMGGMLRYGIPEYRLPKARLDEDIRAILRTGDIRVHTDYKVGRDGDFSALREGHDAVYLALGAQLGNRLPIDGFDAPGVTSAAEFLLDVTEHGGDLTGKRVVLIGGGNVAMDAARTAVRLGAETVHVFTRTRDDYTALESEIQSAMQEGVCFRTLLSFLNIETDRETSAVRAVWLQPEIVSTYDEFGFVNTEHSSNYPYRFKCDLLIMAVGQRSDTDHFAEAGLPTVRGRIDADEACRVRETAGVFSGGDCVTGPSTAIRAIAAGQVAAYNIDEYLGYHHHLPRPVKTPEARPSDFTRIGRAEIEERDPFDRYHDFLHVECPMTDEEAVREAGRCLRCDFYGCGAMEGGRF